MLSFLRVAPMCLLSFISVTYIGVNYGFLVFGTRVACNCWLQRNVTMVETGKVAFWFHCEGAFIALFGAIFICTPIETIFF